LQALLSTKVAKDPVFDLISATDRMGRLLHEQPLYLVRKSLLLENEALYAKALVLYNTRNKIMHEGGPPDEQNPLPIDDRGAWTACNTARDVLAWFGDHGPYLAATGQKFV
jgi:hypothetical protein